MSKKWSKNETKITERPPERKVLDVGKYQYDVVYVNRRPKTLGRHGSEEAKIAYTQFVADWWAEKARSVAGGRNKSPTRPEVVERTNPVVCPTGEDKPGITVSELCADFLDYAERTYVGENYGHFCLIVEDFLRKLYPYVPVGSFGTSHLINIRKELIDSGRYSLNTVNEHTSRVARIFRWGNENALVPDNTITAIGKVKKLREGEWGLKNHPKRKDVPDWVVKETIKFMPPTAATMYTIQRMLGFRTCEVFRMRVGEINRSRGNGFWYYVPSDYKTAQTAGEIPPFPLGKEEQALLAPYLKGKAPGQAVFSFAAAVRERKAEKRASRKTKRTPSQIARDEAREARQQYREFFDRSTYRLEIQYAIEKANKPWLDELNNSLPDGVEKYKSSKEAHKSLLDEVNKSLPDGVKKYKSVYEANESLPDDKKIGGIPYWCPYQIRHTAATETALTEGREEVKALLGHRSIKTGDIYDHSDLLVREELARNRVNPYAEQTEREET